MRLLRIKEVLELTGLSRTTIYRLRREGRFPKGIPLMGSLIAWEESKVFAWIEARIHGLDWCEPS